MLKPTAEIRLPGAVVLVTGGSRGIGAGIARAFLGAGADVIVCGRSTPAQLPQAGGRCAQFSVCDVRDADAVAGLCAAIVAEHERLDVLVNNAGGGPPGELASAPARLIERIIQLNLTAPLLCARARTSSCRRRPRAAASSTSAAWPATGPRRQPSPTAPPRPACCTPRRALPWSGDRKVRVNGIIAGFVATENAAEHYGGEAGIARIGAMFPAEAAGRDPPTSPMPASIWPRRWPPT